MSDTMSARTRAATVATAPAVLLVALVTHPFLPGRLPNDDAVAAAVAADTTRWALVHLATGAASGLVILAFLAIRSYLRDAGEDRSSAVGLVFVVIGSTLLTLLTGLEFAPLAAAQTGADIAAVQAALAPWFVALLATSAFTFAVGILYFVRGIRDARLLSPPMTALVVTSLVVMAASRALPFAAAQFYVQGVAGILALWPLALHMWRHFEPRPAAGTRPTRTTTAAGPQRRIGQRAVGQPGLH